MFEIEILSIFAAIIIVHVKFLIMEKDKKYMLWPIRQILQLKGFVAYPLRISFVALSFIAISCLSCHKGETKHNNTVSQEFEMKTFSDKAVFSNNLPESEFGLHCELEAEVDLLADGPMPLADSIGRFVTMELYNMFDMGGDFFMVEDVLHIPFEEVCKWDGENIVTDFINHYRPLYEKYATGAGAKSLTLKLVSQAETFFTYYEEINYCAGSCNHEYKYYTFRKKDGLLLEEMMSDVNLKKFVKKYPRYENDGDYYVPFIGLSDQGLLYGAYVETGASRGENHVDTIPYKVVRPFLSEEAQELVQDY